MSSVTDFDIVIIGAGFAGLELIGQLIRKGCNRRATIAIVEAQDTIAYIPLVHEIASGQLEPRVSTYRVADWLDDIPNVRRYGSPLIAFNSATAELTLESGERLRGRDLVFALGSSSSPPVDFAGRNDFLALRDLRQAHTLQARLQQALSREIDAPVRVVVVGGGLSAVETAGELAAHVQQRRMGHRLSISLLASGPVLLPALGQRAGQLAVEYLERQRVDVRLRCRAKALDQGGVVASEILGNTDQEIYVPCDLAIWAGGIAPVAIARQLGLALDEHGWIRVDPYLQASPIQSSYARIWAIGDCARIYNERNQIEPTMARAIEAIWQASTLATTLRRSLQRSAASCKRHPIRRTFPHGVSLGEHSLVVVGPVAVDLGDLGVWFRRWLLAMYRRRYETLRMRYAVRPTNTQHPT